MNSKQLSRNVSYYQMVVWSARPSLVLEVYIALLILEVMHVSTLDEAKQQTSRSLAEQAAQQQVKLCETLPDGTDKCVYLSGGTMSSYN